MSRNDHRRQLEALREGVSRQTTRDVDRIGDRAVAIAVRTLYTVANDDELIYR